MKKLILPVVAMLLACTGILAKDVQKVSYRVLNSFETTFINAEEVSWTVKADFTKAKFQMEGEDYEAFYNSAGSFIGLSKKVDFKQLPSNAVKQIKKKYADHSITEAVLFDFEGQSKYFVSLEKDGAKKILEVSAGGQVSNYDPSH